MIFSFFSFMCEIPLPCAYTWQVRLRATDAPADDPAKEPAPVAASDNQRAARVALNFFQASNIFPANIFCVKCLHLARVPSSPVVARAHEYLRDDLVSPGLLEHALALGVAHDRNGNLF